MAQSSVHATGESSTTNTRISENLDSDQTANGIQQVVLRETAFNQVGIRPGLQPLGPILWRFQCRYQNYRQLGELAVGANPVGQGEAIHAWHLDIGNQQIVLLL